MPEPRLSAARKTQTGRVPTAFPVSSDGPATFPAGKVRNGIVSHEDWLPTFAAAGGNTEIVEQLKKGVELNGRTLQELPRWCQSARLYQRQDERVAASKVHVCE